jgi:hypothetical protein
VDIPFRSKLLIFLGVAVLTLVSIVAVSSVLDRQQTSELQEVERHLVPKLELGPALTARFDSLRRGMQDAVAAQDRSALEATGDLRDSMLTLIDQSGDALAPGDAALLRASLTRYYEAALGVSRRLINGETGEGVVEAVSDMQDRHHALAEMIEVKTRLERAELAGAFGSVREAASKANHFRMGIGFGAVMVLLGLSVWMRRGLLRPLVQLSEGFARFATGNLQHRIQVDTRDELGRVAAEANEMAHALHESNTQRDRDDWFKAGTSGLLERLRGELEPTEVTGRALSFLARYLGAVAGAAYVLDDAGQLCCWNRYASAEREGSATEPASDGSNRFLPGEGLLGQSFEDDEILVVDNVPESYFIRSGLGTATPRTLLFVPLTHLERRMGVLELAFFAPCSADGLELLASVRESLVIALEVAKSRAKLAELLERAREQAQRLAAQEEELRTTNDGLVAQQEELRQANEELEVQRAALSSQNQELDAARKRVQQQVEELARVSSYKSQFLANMSHELRTPLNSMLLLSHLLAENDDGRLSEKQVEHCRTIHGAGQDLLGLINQVLELAKIEAGKQDVRFTETPSHHFADQAKRVFGAMASNKGLDLRVELAEDLPATIVTDRPRVERILTNLIGNAIKFTDRGEILLRLGRARPGQRLSTQGLNAESTLAFSVSDTGVGIAPEAIDRIFAPFEQIDSGSEHKPAGTGLGLAIARESAALVGGELQVRSTVGKGTTFTLFLPERAPASVPAKLAPQASPIPVSSTALEAAVDSRAPQLLVIEDDEVLCDQLTELIRARGLVAIAAHSGREGLSLARAERPRGIVLDVRLPDISGWEVMEGLRSDPRTRDIPVHFLSAVDAKDRGLALGAIGYVTKPVTRTELVSVVQSLVPTLHDRHRAVLVVEDDIAEGQSIAQLLIGEGLDAQHVTNATGAFDALTRQNFACIVLDLGLPDLDGLGLLRSIRERTDLHPPRILVHTGRALSKEETRELERYAETVVLKDGHSVERVVEEIRLFVHHVNVEEVDGAGAPKAPPPDALLHGRKLLLVDDDMRTVYAISAFLRGKGAKVLVADTGKEALSEMANNPDVDAVLMDVMMPEMDGYEAMRRLRKQDRFKATPIIALTARAMKGERERCLDAGASDYLPKPVDVRRLLCTLETWLSRGAA